MTEKNSADSTPFIIDMENLKPSEFRELDRDKTCVVVPFAPIEYHGDHLPLGVDFFLAHDALRNGARFFNESHDDWKFLFTPVIPLGADTVPHGGSLWVSPKVIRVVAEEMTKRFIEYGFKRIVLFTGHGGYRQMTALEEVATRLRLKHAAKDVQIISPPTYFIARGNSLDLIGLINEGLDEPMTEEEVRQSLQESHGGRLETSYIMNIKPHLVDDTFKSTEDHEIEPPSLVKAILNGPGQALPGNFKGGAEALAAAMTWFFGGAAKGYLGYPSSASPEFGAALHSAIGRLLSGMLEEFLVDDTYPGKLDLKSIIDGLLRK